MIKYWNPRNVKKTKARRERKNMATIQKGLLEIERARTYTRGDADKNVHLMLDALGLQLRRRMVARLATGGAMSLSKLIAPFHLFLPSGLLQLRILERAGLVHTRKQGRTRICALNREAFRELSAALLVPDILKQLH